MTVDVTDSREEQDEDRSMPGWVYVTPPCETVRTFRPTNSTISCGTAKVGVIGASVSTGLTGDEGTEGSKQYCDKKGSKSDRREKPHQPRRFKESGIRIGIRLTLNDVALVDAEVKVKKVKQLLLHEVDFRQAEDARVLGLLRRGGVESPISRL